MNKKTLLIGLLVVLVVSGAIILAITLSNSSDSKKIENWIVGTWSLDTYAQETYSDGVLQGTSESTNQGKIEFRKDGTGTDMGGNFIGSDFEWNNTDTELILTEGNSTTTYVIENFSKDEFDFSITHTSGTEKEIERWSLSKD